MPRIYTTKFLAPTNHSGARVVVRSIVNGRRKIVPWDYALDVDTNHRAAAQGMAGAAISLQRVLPHDKDPHAFYFISF